MFSFFKKKQVIRFVHTTPGVAFKHPVVKASEIKREWVEKNGKGIQQAQIHLKTCPFDTLRKTVLHSSFIMKCPGIKQFMETGYVVPVPYDFCIDTNGDGVTYNCYHFGATNPGIYETGIAEHTTDQFHNFVNVPQNSLKTVLKVGTGWNIIPHPDYVFLFCPVHYHTESRFTAATGILDPYMSSEINVQLYWHVLKGRELVRAGTPLVQIIPIRRDMVYPEIESDDMTNEEIFKLKSHRNTKLISSHRDYKKIKEAGMKIWSSIKK